MTSTASTTTTTMITVKPAQEAVKRASDPLKLLTLLSWILEVSLEKAIEDFTDGDSPALWAAIITELDGHLTEENFGSRLKWRLSLYKVAHLVLNDTKENWGDCMEEALEMFNEVVPKVEDRDDRFFQRMVDVRVQACLQHSLGTTSGREFLEIVNRLFPVKTRRSGSEVVNKYADLITEHRAKFVSCISKENTVIRKKLEELQDEMPWEEFSHKFRKYLFEIAQAIGSSHLDLLYEHRRDVINVSEWQLLMDPKSSVHDDLVSVPKISGFQLKKLIGKDLGLSQLPNPDESEPDPESEPEPAPEVQQKKPQPQAKPLGPVTAPTPAPAAAPAQTQPKPQPPQTTAPAQQNLQLDAPKQPSAAPQKSTPPEPKPPAKEAPKNGRVTEEKKVAATDDTDPMSDLFSDEDEDTKLFRDEIHKKKASVESSGEDSDDGRDARDRARDRERKRLRAKEKEKERSRDHSTDSRKSRSRDRRSTPEPSSSKKRKLHIEPGKSERIEFTDEEDSEPEKNKPKGGKSTGGKDTDSKDSSSKDKGNPKVPHNVPFPTSGSKKRLPYTQQEINNFLSGLRRHGVGKWALILAEFEFHPNRTSVDLKDKFRNMRKNNEIPKDIMDEFDLH